MKKSKFILRFGAMLLAFTIFIPSISWAQDGQTGQAKIFVYVEGVKGSSTDYNHQGWIDAISFSGGITSPLASLAGGAVAEGATYTPISIFKGLDRATVGLLARASTQEYTLEVIIEVAINDQVIFKYILTGVYVKKSQIDIERGKDIGVVETVVFAYDAIKWEYTDQTGATEQYGWSQAFSKSY